MKLYSLLFLLFTTSCARAQLIYSFDSSAQVNGCANIFLQKISKDLKYELEAQIIIDSLPKLQEFDITKYSKFVTVYLNIYPKGNKYIHGICDDVFLELSKTPIKYNAVSCSMTITKWDKKEQIISIVIKNAVVKSSVTGEIAIPLEYFSNLRVGWIGG